VRNYRCGAARVTSTALGKLGLVESVYTGPISANAFGILRLGVLRETEGSPCAVIRMDRSLMLVSLPPVIAPGVYTARSAPGAVIVRADQYEMWAEYARRLANVGVMRAVFLESHATLAYEWAERQIRLERAILPQ
jgi:hypothetical protein